MSDISAIIAQLPPGTDVFGFLSQMIVDSVYPDLGRVFEVHVYLVTALSSLVLVLVAAGFYVRWRKGRLHFFVADGPATRPNLYVFVPALWGLNAIPMIAFTFWLRNSMESRHLTKSIGTFWWMMVPMVTCSYAVISASVMCTAPIVRKGLIRMNGGPSSRNFTVSVVTIHALIIGVTAIALGSAAYPALLQGDAFAVIHRGFVGMQAMLAEAKATQNTALLATIPQYMDLFDEGENYGRKAVFVGGAVYSSHIIFFLLTALLPSIYLNVYMRKRIDLLEKGLTASSLQKFSALQSRSVVPTISVPMTAANSRARKDIELDDLSDDVRRRPSLLPTLPTLPKDRPFANLAQGTSVLPQAYATIFQATVDPLEKAKRLRLALRRDNLNLLAYCLMLACMGSLAFFQLGKGPYSFDTKQQFIASYLWEMWSYILPATILAIAFLADAVQNGAGAEDDSVPAASLSKWNFQAPPLASIQLSQTVEIVEEHAVYPKRTLYEKFGDDDTYP